MCHPDYSFAFHGVGYKHADRNALRVSFTHHSTREIDLETVMVRAPIQRRQPRPRTAAIPESDPVMQGRPPCAAALGLVDLVGLPITNSPAPMEVKKLVPLHPAGRPLSGMVASSSASRPPTKLYRIPLKPAPLASSSSGRILQVNEELGESREQVYLGNNFREVSPTFQCRAMKSFSPQDWLNSRSHAMHLA